jgi:hypothetical protein
VDRVREARLVSIGRHANMYSTTAIADYGVAFLKEHANDPFFLCLARPIFRCKPQPSISRNTRTVLSRLGHGSRTQMGPHAPHRSRELRARERGDTSPAPTFRT